MKKISKDEFYSKSKYNPKTIDKLLHQSVYPYQINDYILLRIPEWLKTKLKLKKKYIPADYQLANFINFLWKKKIIMFHWNQPKNKFGGIGSIDCYKNTLYSLDMTKLYINPRNINHVVIYICMENMIVILQFTILNFFHH